MIDLWTEESVECHSVTHSLSQLQSDLISTSADYRAQFFVLSLQNYFLKNDEEKRPLSTSSTNFHSILLIKRHFKETSYSYSGMTPHGR